MAGRKTLNGFPSSPLNERLCPGEEPQRSPGCSFHTQARAAQSRHRAGQVSVHPSVHPSIHLSVHQAPSSTSLLCSPARPFPYELIFPWLSEVLLWQGNCSAVTGKQIQAVLSRNISIQVLCSASGAAEGLHEMSWGESVCQAL